jgi:hypothetical protein
VLAESRCDPVAFCESIYIEQVNMEIALVKKKLAWSRSIANYINKIDM